MNTSLCYYVLFINIFLSFDGCSSAASGNDGMISIKDEELLDINGEKDNAIQNNENNAAQSVNTPNGDDGYKMFTSTEEILDKDEVNYEKVDFEVKSGYTLTVFHLIPKIKRGMENKPFIFFQHGVMSSSSSWVLYGGQFSLPLIFVEAGFDVWIGNARGNRYGYRHKEFSPDTDEFWDFGPEDLANDLDHVLDEIFTRTGKSKVYYIGHSMGTTIFFIFCSMNPAKCNKNVKAMVALAPVVYVSHINAVIRLFSKFSTTLSRFFNYALNGKIALNETIQFLASCKSKYESVKKRTLGIINYFGKKAEQHVRGNKLDCTLVNNSAKTFVHYAQICQAGKFQRFDFCSEQNSVKYGMEVPPEYKLESINIPLALYYSEKDFLSTIQDVEKLIEKLKKEIVKVKYLVPDKAFEHQDFLFGKHVKELLFDQIASLIASMEFGNIKNNSFHFNDE